MTVGMLGDAHVLERLSAMLQKYKVELEQKNYMTADDVGDALKTRTDITSVIVAERACEYAIGGRNEVIEKIRSYDEKVRILFCFQKSNPNRQFRDYCFPYHVTDFFVPDKDGSVDIPDIARAALKGRLKSIEEELPPINKKSGRLFNALGKKNAEAEACKKNALEELVAQVQPAPSAVHTDEVVVVEKPVPREIIVEVPYDVIVEKRVPREVVKEVIEEVIIEKRVQKEVVVEKPVPHEVIVEVPYDVIVEKRVPREIVKEIFEDVIVEKKIPREVIVEVPYDVIVEKPVPREVVVEVTEDEIAFSGDVDVSDSEINLNLSAEGTAIIGVFNVCRGAGSSTMSFNLATEAARQGVLTYLMSADECKDFSMIKNRNKNLQISGNPSLDDGLVEAFSSGAKLIVLDFGLLLEISPEGELLSELEPKTKLFDRLRSCHAVFGMCLSAPWHISKLSYFEQLDFRFTLISDRRISRNIRTRDELTAESIIEQLFSRKSMDKRNGKHKSLKELFT